VAGCEVGNDETIKYQAMLDYGDKDGKKYVRKTGITTDLKVFEKKLRQCMLFIFILPITGDTETMCVKVVTSQGHIVGKYKKIWEKLGKFSNPLHLRRTMDSINFNMRIF